MATINKHGKYPASGYEVDGLMIYMRSKAEVIKEARYHGYAAHDLHKAYHKYFGFKGYIVGKFDGDTFTGIGDETGKVISAEVYE